MATTRAHRRVLIRCDSYGSVGLGHLSRCINLARIIRDEAPDAEIAFWGRYESFAASLLANYGLGAMQVPPSGWDFGALSHVHDVCSQFDVVVLDSYYLEQSHVDGLKGRHCKLVIIDDMQQLDLSGADVVVCFRAGAESVDYGAHVQFLGPAYLLVKPELQALRERNLRRSPAFPLRRVLIFISGSDGWKQATGELLSALALSGLQLSYVAPSPISTGPRAGVNFLALTPTIELVYAETDFVVSGGGMAKYESAYCCIPNASLSLTPLTHADTQIMARYGVTADLGMADDADCGHAVNRLLALIGNPGALAAQRAASASVFDGSGAKRVAQAVLSL